MKVFLYCILFILLGVPVCFSQTDSAVNALQSIPLKYIKDISTKIDKYTSQISSKTEKTLTKLSRWENKIKGLLQKASPETAEILFGNNQITFTSLLVKIKQGEALGLQYKSQYDQYRDELTTDIKYLQAQKENINQKLLQPLQGAQNKITALNEEEDKNEAIQQFIKERKRQLISQAIQQIGKSKYLVKINKEAFYYTETIKNYKEIFNDSKKVEEIVKQVLGKIPAFQQFIGQNSGLSGIFSSPFSFASLSSTGSVPVVNGLPNRAAVQNFIMASIPAATTNPVKQLQMPDMKVALAKWRDKLNSQGGTKDHDLPDFKPNSQRSKTLKQRLEHGPEFQFTQSVNGHPAIANIGMKIGYKLNDKSSVGVGVNYALGLGEGWNKIHASHEGIGLRTYLSWKLKNSFSVQGGSEWNHLKFTNFNQLKTSASWQYAALIGLSKKYNVSKKMKGSMQILYDFLAYRHTPVSQPVLFRFGYNL